MIFLFKISAPLLGELISFYIHLKKWRLPQIYTENRAASREQQSYYLKNRLKPISWYLYNELARFTVLKCPGNETGNTSTRLFHTPTHNLHLNLCKYKYFAYKSLIISILNKIRYNSICIKGVNSHYFSCISIYFHVLYIKTQ